MRMAFGLVSLLVVIGIMAVFFRTIEAPTIQKGRETQDVARQIAGRGPDNRPASETVTLEPTANDDGILVKDIDPTGALATYYGLQKGDLITAIDESGNSMPVKGFPGGASVAMARVLEAGQRMSTITVTRGPQKDLVLQSKGPLTNYLPGAGR